MKSAAIALLNVVLWILYELLVALPLWVIGFPLCFVLAQRHAWKLLRDGVWTWRPRWAWLWANDNDGVTGPKWWWIRHDDWPLWRLAFVWSAWRNSVNNLHLVPYLHPVIDPERIQYVANSTDPARNGAIDRKPVEWAFTWQGIYAGFVVRWQINSERHFQFRIGWKLLPKDRLGVPDGDHRKVRCPFGLQLHLWRSEPA